MISRILLILCCIVTSGLLPAQSGSSPLQGTESTFFMQTNAERGYVICPSGDGNIYLAGRKDNLLLLQKMTPEGVFLFSRTINVSGGLPDAAADMIVDSEGKLVLAINTFEDTALEPFVLRYDPVSDAVLWTRSFKGQLQALFGLMENGPGGNIVVYHSVQTGTGSDAQITQLDRNTGDWIPDKSYRYHLGASDEITSMVLDKDGAYAVGRFTDGDGNIDMRQVLMKIDLETGQPGWSRLGHVDPNAEARLYGRDLVLDQDAIVSTYSGNESGDDLSSTHIFLQKTSKTGELLWVTQYDLPEWSTEFAEELVSVSDGYVLLGRSLLADQGWIFMLKTDKDGIPMWAKKVEHEYNNDLIGFAQGQLVAVDDYLYATGYTEHVSSNSRMFVLKTAADGSVSNSCTVLEPTPVEWTEIMSPSFYPVNPERPAPDILFQTLSLAKPAESLATQSFVCRQAGVDDCQDLPDATFTMDSIVCAGGQARLYYTECNLGNVPMGSFIVRFYPENPTQTAADDKATLLLLNTTTVKPGECRSGSMNIALGTWFPVGTAGQQQIFSLANIVDDANYPVSLDSFPYNNFEECLYTNNLSSLTFAINDPGLDLGPDVISCTGDPIPLDAGAGFVKYAWSTGAQTPSILASDPGVYWVEVTDECGFKHRDSMFFTFSLITDTRFPDTVICPGASLLYAVPGFSTYSWAPAGGGLSCTDCAAVTITPAVTTTYTLFASDSLGCVLRDTFTINVYQGSDLSIDCPASVTVTAASGATSAAVDYAIGVSSDCPCGGPTLLRTQGLASGANFPLGSTQVCYSATDACGSGTTCCFTVTVSAPSIPADEPCDVKITPCIKYEILGITQNPAKQKTYRIRLTNTCAQKLVYAAFQLPDGMIADKPAAAVYTSPAGRQYELRNPSNSPFYSIRFKAIGDGIAGGQSDIFEYTLPPQADPLFIHATVRLEPQTFYETHMNVFACEVMQVANRPAATERTALPQWTDVQPLQVYPNPASELLQVDLSAWEGTVLRLRLSNAVGQVVLDQAVEAGADPFVLRLPAQLAQGLYQVQVTTSARERATARFVLQR